MKKTKMVLSVCDRSTVKIQQNILKNERNRNSANETFSYRSFSFSQLDVLRAGSRPIRF
jgi:hypothetical protein